MTDKCNCTMSISVLGDGCRYCQPQEYIDRLSETIDELNADNERIEKELHELKRAREGWKLVPIQLTEEMIQSACLKQSIEDYSSYNEWLESHSTGISESIRNYIISDYKAMLKASPKEPS